MGLQNPYRRFDSAPRLQTTIRVVYVIGIRYCGGHFSIGLRRKGRDFTYYLQLRHTLVEISLETCEELPYLFRSAKVSHGVGDGIVILEFQQRRRLLLVQFLRTDIDVLGEYKIEERLLLRAKPGIDHHFGVASSFSTRERWQGVDRPKATKTECGQDSTCCRSYPEGVAVWLFQTLESRMRLMLEQTNK